MTEHEHTHMYHTECPGEGCEHVVTIPQSHTHDGGHSPHMHRVDGLPLVKTDETDPVNNAAPTGASGPVGLYIAAEG
jgi:hypothetical protein